LESETRPFDVWVVIECRWRLGVFIQLALLVLLVVRVDAKSRAVHLGLLLLLALDDPLLVDVRMKPGRRPSAPSMKPF